MTRGVSRTLLSGVASSLPEAPGPAAEGNTCCSHYSLDVRTLGASMMSGVTLPCPSACGLQLIKYIKVPDVRSKHQYANSYAKVIFTTIRFLPLSSSPRHTLLLCCSLPHPLWPPHHHCRPCHLRSFDHCRVIPPFPPCAGSASTNIMLARKDIPAIIGPWQDLSATFFLCPSANGVSCAPVNLDQHKSEDVRYEAGKQLSSVAISQLSTPSQRRWRV